MKFFLPWGRRWRPEESTEGRWSALRASWCRTPGEPILVLFLPAAHFHVQTSLSLAKNNRKQTTTGLSSNTWVKPLLHQESLKWENETFSSEFTGRSSGERRVIQSSPPLFSFSSLQLELLPHQLKVCLPSFLEEIQHSSHNFATQVEGMQCPVSNTTEIPFSKANVTGKHP